jgi:hypothetical protein
MLIDSSPRGICGQNPVESRLSTRSRVFLEDTDKQPLRGDIESRLQLRLASGHLRMNENGVTSEPAQASITATSDSTLVAQADFSAVIVETNAQVRRD